MFCVFSSRAVGWSAVCDCDIPGHTHLRFVSYYFVSVILFVVVRLLNICCCCCCLVTHMRTMHNGSATPLLLTEIAM